MTRRFLSAPRRHYWRWVLLAVFLAGVQLAAAGSPPGEGEPFLQYFSPRDYHGPTECTSVAQDARGVIYAGSLGVVLEYDGSSWRQIPMPGCNFVQSLAYEKTTDRVFVGAQNNLGYLQLSPGRERIFVSLLDQLPPDARDVGTITEIFSAPDGIFFVGTTQVARWRGGRFQTWKLPTATKLRSAWAAGCLYVSSPEIGLLRLDGDHFTSASQDALFRHTSVRAVVTDAAGTLLVGTLHDGMFALRDGVPRPVESECGAFLKEKGIFKVRRLRDGSLAIATDTAGLLVLDSAGHFRNRVDGTGGLHGNNISQLFEDAEGGLWIGLFSGLARAEINSPLSVLRAGPGEEMANSYSAAYWFDTMVLGNPSGLYRLVPADPATATGARLERLPGTTNSSVSICAVDNGLLMVTDGQVKFLAATAPPAGIAGEIVAPSELCASRLHPGRVYIADGRGQISVLRFDSSTGRWTSEGCVAATGKSGDVSMAESVLGDLWLGTQEAGLFRVQLAAARPAVVTSYSDRPGPLRGEHFTPVCEHGGPLDIRTPGRLFRLDDSGQTIRPLTEFGERFNDGSLSIEKAMNYDARNLWITARSARDPKMERIVGRATAGGPDHEPAFRPLPHKIEDVIGEVSVFHPLDVQPAPLATLLVVGTTGNGVVRLDVRAWEAQRSAPPFVTLIRRAVTGNGASADGEAPILQEPLPYRRNSTRFEYAASTMAFGAAARFQTRLAGFGEGEWSDWSARTSVDYLNLPEGAYTFEARARNSDGQLGSVASLPFRILPPWQRTPWAYTIYALALALGLFALGRWRGRQLRQRNATLEALVDARTSELRGREAELLANERALVRARDEAETANRAKSAFLANMSHELRTPLNAILGYTQILLKGADLPARNREQVQVIGQSGGHLLALINEVLDLSKIEAGKLTLRPFDFSLPSLLDEAGAVFRPRFAEKGLAFTESRAPGLPATVHADPSRLRQVLFNLLGNAAKFTQQGSVRLEARPGETGRVRFEVADTGVGIEEGELDHIFLAFHQAGESRLAVQGTGLGLAISQRLVGLLGGRIEVASTPGRGSRFWFELPLPAVEPSGGLPIQNLTDPRHGHVAGYEGAPRRLLLVDDLAENRRVLRDFLQPLGFEIEEAASGAECLEACARQVPDAVLLDLRLGAMDGFEVARALRTRMDGAPLGIVAISASVFESDRQRAIDAGCDGFLPKPFEESALLGTLGRVLGLRWVYASEVVSPPLAEAGAKGEESLPREETAALLELSLRGDVVGIRNRLDALLAAGVSDGTAMLVRRLEALAATYQMDDIHALLLSLQDDAGN